MTSLSVNLNAVAYLRNRRDIGWPNLLEIADIVMRSGTHGLTVHPRPDERHIRRSDVYALNAWMSDKYPEAEFNIEGYPNDAFLALVADIRPAQVTLVPDDPEQSTSDHGWNLAAQSEFLKSIIELVKGHGSRVSIFVDADPDNAALTKTTGTDRVEIYTGPYGAASNPVLAERLLKDIRQTADAVGGIGINAGHDLTVENLPALIRAVPELAEVSIGHGITSAALIDGFERATLNYLSALMKLDQRGGIGYVNRHYLDVAV